MIAQSFLAVEIRKSEVRMRRFYERARTAANANIECIHRIIRIAVFTKAP
jgi:hypothetical protein